MITRILLSGFLFVFATGAPLNGRASSWSPACIGSEMDILWPDYDDSSRFFECIYEFTPMLMYCSKNKLFSFVHQDCVDAAYYVPPPKKEYLPTEKPLYPVTSTTPNLPTPRPVTTSAKPAVTTVGTKPQEITTKATTKKTTKATTAKPTKEPTTKKEATTKTTKPPTEPGTTKPPTKPPTEGRPQPPTQGTSAKPTTPGPTAKPPNTTTTKKTTKAPGIGGITTLAPKTTPTPPHINEPNATPPIS